MVISHPKALDYLWIYILFELIPALFDSIWIDMANKTLKCDCT